MVFSSPLFLFYFLPLTMVIYFLVHKLIGTKASNLVLLVFSILFYAFGEGAYVLVIVLSIGWNFLVGVMMDRFESYQKPILLSGVAVNVLLLIYFKYLGFLGESFEALASSVGLQVELNWPNTHLPIGISFFTFQAISYLVDIYRKEAQVQKNILDMGLYISLFPQLIAGPIVRYEMVDAEIRNRQLTLSGVSNGLKLFSVGLFMKVCLADTMAFTADTIFAYPILELSTGTAWLATLSYSLQIFFDFAGYSLMAIGLGLASGFTFPRNFDQPYISKSIREFWRRWHISLSTWFRDYVYIPLGGNRKSSVRTYFNLLAIFLLTGIWHGASWNFVIWGLIHGFFIILERLGALNFLQRLPALFSHLYLLVVVITAWVFFRVESFGEAIAVITKMYWPHSGGHPQYSSVALNTTSWFWITFVICIIWAMWRPEPLRKNYTIELSKNPIRTNLISAFGAFTLFLISLIFVTSNTYSSFIYFRF